MPVALLLVSAVTVAALDQLSKVAVTRPWAGGSGVMVGSVGIRRLTNRRGSVLALSPRAAAVVGTLAVGLGVAVVASASGPAVALGVGLMLGGAAGNLIDRFARGGVVDFVVLGPWPAFNVADVALVAGAVLIYGSAL